MHGKAAPAQGNNTHLSQYIRSICDILCLVSNLTMLPKNIMAHLKSLIFKY